MCRHDDDPETISKTAGRAIPGTEVRTVDDDGSPVAPGEPGEVVVRGYNVMKGYIHDPEATAEAIDADGWLHTGDIGVLDERGNLRITDRKKDMFIVGGFNAYPAEIEGMILEHPGVSQVAVVGVPDTRMGEVGYAYVVPRPAGPSSTPTSCSRGASRAWRTTRCRVRRDRRRAPAQRERQGREVRAPRAARRATPAPGGGA